jgi:hypothetical protein
MPTHIDSRALARSNSSRLAQFIDALNSDELTILLLWTGIGLAISLCVAAFGLEPDLAQSLLMLG